MAIYYISACHDCKEKVMWAKCPIETAEIYHEEFENILHKGHNVELGHDMDDNFYFGLTGYGDLGIKDGIE